MESDGHQFEDADSEFGFIPHPHEARIDVSGDVEVTEEQVQAETLGKLLALFGGKKDAVVDKWPDIVLTIFGIGAAGILSLHGDHGLIAVAILVLVAARGR